MPSENKPNVNTVWASTGEATSVSADKQALGYVEEIPFYDDFNGHMQQISRFQKHCNQEGIPVWDEDTPYFVGGSAKSPVDKNVYRAVADNTGVPPISSVGGAVNAAWVRWSYTLPELMDAVSDIFVATINPFAAPPGPGWLLCNGANVSRATYAKLFSKIGTTYGTGNGTTTFGLPELRGEFIRGLDNGRGIDAGRANGSFQVGTTHAYAKSAGGAGTVGASWADELLGFEQGTKEELNTEQSIVRGGRIYPAGTTYQENPATTVLTTFKSRPRNVAFPYYIKF